MIFTFVVFVVEQMEMEEFKAGLSVSMDAGEDNRDEVAEAGHKKPRHSWKTHQIETGGGCGDALYACDQCDKTFGKQSSLARHKYEHSGTDDTSTVAFGRTLLVSNGDL